MTLVATGRAKLLLFSRQKIVKEFTLPFSDCNTILVYRNRLGKEFLITRSGAAAGATAIIDLLSSKVYEDFVCFSYLYLARVVTILKCGMLMLHVL